MKLSKTIAQTLCNESAQHFQAFQKQRRMDRFNFALLLHMNENLPVLLVGVSLAFAVERVLNLFDAQVSDGIISFCILGLNALLWMFASIAHIRYTIAFVILQKALPEATLKTNSARTLKAFEFVFLGNDGARTELRTLRRCYVALCCLLCLLLLTGACGFLYRNGVINLDLILFKVKSFFTCTP